MARHDAEAQAVQAGGAPSLPPLTQPTGELPKIPTEASGPAETVVVAAADGVFSERSDDSVPSRFDSPVPSSLPAADDPFAISDAQSRFDRPDAQSGFDRPDAQSGFDRPDAQSRFDRTAAMSSVGSDRDRIDLTADADVDLVAVETDLGRPGRDDAPTNPFDDPTDAGQFGASPRAVAGRPFERAGSMADGGDQTMAMGVSAAAARQSAGRGVGTDIDGPADFGQAPRGSSRPERRPDADARLQDTEFKLADKRRKQKPKEPNRLLLALAMGLVLLAGVAVAWFLTRDGGDETEVADGTEVAATEPESASQQQPEETLPAADPEPQVDVPTLFFEAAQTGPLQQGETYSIELYGEPEGSMLQVVVDDIQQGVPDVQLPDLILPAGRHSLYIDITNGAEVAQSTRVDVYVLGDLPPRGYRANLSSVDIQNEGWVEAVRQFDEFRAAGHEGLQLAPLSDGYWNIFVGDLGEDRAAAQNYCESFGLAVPDQCFPTYFEGGPAPAETTDTTAAEAMEDGADGSSSSTTAAGG